MKEYEGWELLRDLVKGKFKEGDEFVYYVDNIKNYLKVSTNMFGDFILIKQNESVSVNSSLLSKSTRKFIKVEKDIDWSKIPRGTKVQYKDYEEYEWYNGYFIEKNYNKDYKFEISKLKEDDSFSGLTMEDCYDCYKYCRIHPDVEIKEEWYK